MAVAVVWVSSVYLQLSRWEVVEVVAGSVYLQSSRKEAVEMVAAAGAVCAESVVETVWKPPCFPQRFWLQ